MQNEENIDHIVRHERWEKVKEEKTNEFLVLIDNLLIKGAMKSYQKIIFLSATKIGKNTKQHFKLPFLKRNSQLGPSN